MKNSVGGKEQKFLDFSYHYLCCITNSIVSQEQLYMQISPAIPKMS